MGLRIVTICSESTNRDNRRKKDIKKLIHPLEGQEDYHEKQVFAVAYETNTWLMFSHTTLRRQTNIRSVIIRASVAKLKGINPEGSQRGMTMLALWLVGTLSHFIMV